MPIENINLLQHGADLEGLMRDHDYYVNALANLGQRQAMKSDTIKYTHFTFKEMFNIHDDLENNIGFMYRTDNDSIYYGITNINDISIAYSATGEMQVKTPTLLNNSKELKNISDRYILNNDVSFTITVNNVENISKYGSSIHVTDNYFVSNLRCKILGCDNDDDNNVEWQWTKIQLSTGRLDSAVRAFHLMDDYYVMLVVERDIDVEYMSYYTFKCYLLNTSTILGKNDNLTHETIKSFKNFFRLHQSETIQADTTFVDANVQEKFDSINDFVNATDHIYNMFIDYRVYEQMANYTITLECDTLKNVSLSIKEEDVLSSKYNNINEILKHDILGTYHRITALNDDLTITFPNMLNYWTTNQFIRTRNIFIERIFIKLFEQLCSNYDDDKQHVMFVPLDYKFNYICDNSNILNLYYTDDLYVSLMNLKQFDNETKLHDFLSGTNNVIFDYDGEDKIKLFNIIMEYNNKYDQYINNIVVHERYTLPFVNAQNNWQINDVDTNVRAVGKNAGKPNIIIIDSTHTTNDDTKPVVVFGYDIEQIRACDYVLTRDNAFVPVVTNKNIDIFDDALLLNIVKTDKRETTLFYALNDNGVFDKLMINGSEVNITSLFNLANEIKDTIQENNLANRNKFNFIVFGNNNATVDHETTNFANSIYFYVGDAKNAYNIAEMTVKCPEIDEHNEYLVESGDIKQLKIRYIDNYMYAQDYNDSEEFNTTEYSIYTSNEVKVLEFDYTYLTQYTSDHKFTTEEIMNIIDAQTGISQETSIMFVEIISGEQQITEESQKIVITYRIYIKTGNEYPEYTMNGTNVPVIKLSDTLLRDVNVMNRNNIISVDKKGELMYSYIGTSFTDEDKTTLHIGTSNMNINMGLDTMLTPSKRDKFKKQHKLSIDFDNTTINSKTFMSNGPVMLNHNVDGMNFYTSNCDVVGKTSETKYRYYIDPETNEYCFAPEFAGIDNAISFDVLNNSMFLHTFDGQTANSGYKYFLNVNYMLKTYFNIDVNDEIYNDWQIMFNDSIDEKQNILISEYNIAGKYYKFYMLYVDNLSILKSINEKSIALLRNIHLACHVTGNVLYVNIYNDLQQNNIIVNTMYDVINIDTNDSYAPETPNNNNNTITPPSEFVFDDLYSVTNLIDTGGATQEQPIEP